ncbi:hypothetical protein M5K25_000112 [Dendrobium thyrsiflorum]|uniref:Uncharacterized protein n=1 Tax=Dendrobium thyrsiflorum TaxID=117978 RepID=A0ABD0VSZ9_DENTH
MTGKSFNKFRFRIFEENPAAFRRPLPGAGSPIGLGGDHAWLGLGSGDGGGFDGVGGGSGGWRSAAGLAVGDGLEGGRSSKEAARARRQEFGRRRCRPAAVRSLASSPASQRQVSSESVRLGHVWLGCWSRSRPATEKQWVALESAGDWQCRSVTDQVAGVDEVGIDLLRPEQLESEALASKFLSLSTGIFCQQIPEYEVQPLAPRLAVWKDAQVVVAELVALHLTFSFAFWIVFLQMRKLRDHAFLLKLQGVRASQRLSSSSNSSWLLHGISTSCISFSRIRPSRMALNSHDVNRYGGSHCSSYRKL